MKIALANSSFGGGGITSYAHEFINNYSKDNEVVVIIGDDSKHPILTPNVQIFKYDCNDISFVNVKKNIHLINEIIKPDVLVCSCTKTLCLCIPYLLDNIKIITISHSLKYIESDIAAFNNKYIDAIIALSEQNKINIEHKFKIKDKNKIHVVYNFIASLNNSSEILSDKLNNKVLNIVYPGGTNSPKSPEIVTQIINSLLENNLNFNFYWLGSTKTPLKGYAFVKDVREIIKNDDRVIFTGDIKRQEAESIISKANIFLLTSRREGCPMSLLESLRVGTIPIVADYKHACTDLIKNKENGFVINHNNPIEFVNIISKIILDHNSFKYIYTNSYDTFKSKTSFPVWKNNMDDIILNTNSKHCHRKSKFNTIRCFKDTIIIKLLSISSWVQILFSERIVMMYSLIKQKIKLNKAKNKK